MMSNMTGATLQCLILCLFLFFKQINTMDINGYLLSDSNALAMIPSDIVDGPTKNFWNLDPTPASNFESDKALMDQIYSELRSSKTTKSYSSSGSGFTTADLTSLSKFPTETSTQLDLWDHREQESTQQFIGSTQQFVDSYSDPFEQFVISKQLEYCPVTQLCSFSVNNSASSSKRACCTECKCGNACRKESNDCCPDDIFISDNYTVMPVKQCLPLRLNTRLLSTPKARSGAIQISYCPSYSTETEHMMCEQDYKSAGTGTLLSDVIPVIDTYTEDVYRNVHCAKCHHVEEKKLKSFEAHLSCKVKPNTTLPEANFLQGILRDTNCDIEFSMTTYLIEYCSYAISECNVTGQWDIFNADYVKACKMYRSTYEGNDGILYNNVFCAICNGISDLPRECMARRTNAPSPSNAFSFTGRLSFSTSAKSRRNWDSVCSDNQIFSDKLNKCIAVECSPFRILKGNTCMKFVQETEYMLYEITLRLRPLSDFSLQAAYIDTRQLLEKIGRAARSTNPSIYIEICTTDVLLKPEVNETDFISEDLLRNANVEAYYVKVKARAYNKHDPEDVLNIVRVPENISFSGIKFDIAVIDGYDVDFNRLSSRMKSAYGFPSPDVDGHVLNSMAVNAFKSEVVEGYIIPAPRANVQCNPNEAYVPVTSIMTCPLVKVTKAEYWWKMNDSSVTFVNTNTTLQFNKFHFATDTIDTVMVCFEEYERLVIGVESKQVHGYGPSFSMEVIVAVGFVGLSLVCLVVTLFTFCSLPTFWTLPGENNMALVLSLILAQSFYLIGSLARVETASLPCKIVGILTHFFWLLSVFWMQCCTFHMYTLFSKVQAPDTQNLFKRYVFYHAYCLVMSASCVLVNIGVSYFVAKPSSLGYGDNNCFISSEIMLAYTFCLPLAIVILSNFGMFLAVVISIKRNSMVSDSLKKERNQLTIFAYLSTITGLTWTVGFLYIWTRLSALSYAFIVFNAAQGVYIMVAFICNSRVMRLCAKRSKGSTSQNYTFSSKETTPARAMV